MKVINVTNNKIYDALLWTGAMDLYPKLEELLGSVASQFIKFAPSNTWILRHEGTTDDFISLTVEQFNHSFVDLAPERQYTIYKISHNNHNVFSLEFLITVKSYMSHISDQYDFYVKLLKQAGYERSIENNIDYLIVRDDGFPFLLVSYRWYA